MINDNSSQWTPFQLDRVIRGHLLIVPLWFDGNAAEGMESSRPKRRWDQLQQWQWGEARCLKKGHPKNGDFNRKKHGWWGAIHPLTCTVLWPYILGLHLAFSLKFHEVLGSLIFWGCIGYQSQMHYFVQPTRRRVVSKSVECCDFCWISGPLAQLNSWRWRWKERERERAREMINLSRIIWALP